MTRRNLLRTALSTPLLCLPDLGGTQQEVVVCEINTVPNHVLDCYTSIQWSNLLEHPKLLILMIGKFEGDADFKSVMKLLKKWDADGRPPPSQFLQTLETVIS